MSAELSHRLDELSGERVRLREAIRRIGQTFASSLDRPALLELALKTAVDAVQASGGRLTVRASAEAHAAAVSVAAVTLGPLEPHERARGVITVARRGRPFTDDDLEVLRPLGTEAALALENIELHCQVRRQTVTDELTGLWNHGRFRELLNVEIDQVRRYHHPIGLIMLDIDDFKAVNDTYGHPQGDAVLRQVARLLQENSRDADSRARYGGEELSMILPQTDLEGAHAIAERIRTAVEGLRIAGTDEQRVLRITASLGVAASTDGDKDALIADADGALYEAKRGGKNRPISALARAADASGAG
jgi:diguanylate cyclase (GGDEF)-like protein